MANIRASALVTSIISVALSIGEVSASVQPMGIVASTAPKVSLSASVVLIPFRELEHQTVSMSDSLTMMEISKVLIDVSTATDNVAISIEKTIPTDTITVADSKSISTTKAVSDTTTTADSNTKSTTKNTSDTATATDTDSKSTTKNTSDTATMADSADKSTTKNTTDTTTATDSADKSTTKNTSDTTTMADSADKSTTKNTEDTVSTTDSLQSTLAAANPYFDYVFLADDKYSYFPVLGTLNGHMINQPLLDGEFVLTIDPNTGIVYIIRPWALSFTFGWYGINANQFN
jgi:hypothetical protein